MIIEVTEFNYKGFMLYLEKDKGWKIILGDVAYLFPYATAAESAIDEFIREVTPRHNGKKIKS